MLGVLVNAVTSVLTYSLVLTVGLWCWFQWSKWDLLQAARKMPVTFPLALPVFGNTLAMFQSWEGVSKTIIEMSRSAVTKGLYNVVLWVGPMPLVVVHKLDDIQKILNTSCTTEKGDEMNYMKYVVGNGLLCAPGHIWKVTRRHITPLFHLRNIEQLMETFNRNSRELAMALADHVDGKPVNLLHPTMSVALKTVYQLIFGTELVVDTKTTEFQELIEAVEKVPSMFIMRIVQPWLRFDSVFQLIYRKELKKIDELLNNITRINLSNLKVNYVNKINSELSSQPQLAENVQLQSEGALKLVDIYTELQKKYTQFTEQDFKYETATMFGTGTDTAGLTVSTCLLVLGKHKDLQDRVYEEINSVVGQDDDVTPDHISRMTYLDQVYKETLRWAIIVPYILRKTAEELKLSTCTIPAGNTVVVGLIGPHIDPSIYPDPHKFDPERFSPENSASRGKNAFLPFSGGSRMCIAKTYSEHFVKTMLVHILKRYKVATDMDIYNLKKKLMVTLVNSEGYHVSFQRR